MYAVARPTKELLALFEKAKQLEPTTQDKDRNLIFDRALKYVSTITEEEWIQTSKEKIKFDFEGEIPTSLKVRVLNEELYSNVINTFKTIFELERVKTPYFMKLCLLVYIHKLNVKKSDKLEVVENNPNPIISKINSWITYSENEPKCDYKGNEIICDIYRALNDSDCKLTGGNLLADTIFSAWYPLKMVLECLNDKKFYKQDKYGCDPHHYLKEIQSNIDKLLPKEKEVVQKLYEFFSIANTRGNVMILPNRQMQSRGIDYLDQMPKTLYECFEGGKFSRYFGEDLTVENWVEREHLEDLFFDGNIKKDRIKSILKSKKANEFYWLIDENEIISMLENFISVIQNRNLIYNNLI